MSARVSGGKPANRHGVAIRARPRTGRSAAAAIAIVPPRNSRRGAAFSPRASIRGRSRCSTWPARRARAPPAWACPSRAGVGGPRRPSQRIAREISGARSRMCGLISEEHHDELGAVAAIVERRGAADRRDGGRRGGRGPALRLLIGGKAGERGRHGRDPHPFRCATFAERAGADAVGVAARKYLVLHPSHAQLGERVHGENPPRASTRYSSRNMPTGASTTRRSSSYITLDHLASDDARRARLQGARRAHRRGHRTTSDADHHGRGKCAGRRCCR